MTPAELASRIVQKLSNVRAHQAQAVIELLQEGATIPFIARYRKERTGELDEVQLRDVQRAAEALEQLESRRETIIKSLKDQGILDEKLLQSITLAEELTQLEDLYAPYRPRRVTRAQRAIEAGLKPLADAVFQDERHALKALSTYRCEAYPDDEQVRQGLIDILAERFADSAVAREQMRHKLKRFGALASKKKRGAEEDPKYQIYLDFSAPLSRLRPHQVLAMRRGEREGALSLKLAGEEQRWVEELVERYAYAEDRDNAALLKAAIEEGTKRLLMPQLERELRGGLEADADTHAIKIFSLNLKNLLLCAPLPGRVVLGLDPGLRTGCKLAVVGPQGDVLGTDTIYLHDNRQRDAVRQLQQLIQKYKISLIAIGNGTGTQPAQEAVVEAIDGLSQDRHSDAIRYAVVDESGASIYSASELARAELPGMDVSLRGAVSIARRLQDPLAELVKIDPQSVGVGMYQHDVDQRELARALDAVVEDVVNAVGVDVNSASVALLSRVAGLGPTRAGRVVEWRAEHGALTSRAQLREVKGIGAKTFEQCAGFLRIRRGSEPLDETGIHPESYALARAVLKAAQASAPSPTLQAPLRALLESEKLDALAAKHGVGRPTLVDIVDGLTRPGRDPREDLDAPQLRDKLLTMEQLEPGMRLEGTVRNVVDFGAFIDIGVKQDGLVHISQMSRERVTSPYEVLSVGERVEVTIQEVDIKRGRISLSMV